MEPFDFSTTRGEAGPVARSAAAALAAVAPRSALVLAALLRRSVEIEADGPEALHPGELDEHDPIWFTIGRLGLAAIPAGSLIALADALLGGPGLAEEREPTDLEISLVATRLTATLEPAAAALQPFGLRDLVLEPCDDLAATSGPLVAFGYHFSIAPPRFSVEAPTEVSVTLAFPTSMFTPHDRSHGLDPVSPEMQSALQSVPLDVDIRFHPLTLAAGELDELAIGDVIRLDHPVDDPLTGLVDGRPLLLAKIGRAGRNVAVEVVDVTQEIHA